MQNNVTAQTKYSQKMRLAGLRNTHVRKSIFGILLETEKPLTIQNIVSKINDAHFVSVYRSIDSMHKAGIVKLVPQGFKNMFELSDIFKPHHHHATCEHCGRTVELQEPTLERLMIEITKKAGLTPTKHHFELFGLCSSCVARV